MDGKDLMKLAMKASNTEDNAGMKDNDLITELLKKCNVTPNPKNIIRVISALRKLPIKESTTPQ